MLPRKPFTMKKSTWSWIITLAVILIVVAYQVGQSSNNRQSSPSISLTQPPVASKVAPVKSSNPSANNDESRACAQQTMAMVNSLNVEADRLQQQFGLSGNISSYQNYFNTKENKCYALVFSTSSYKNTFGSSEDLYDVYANQRIANYSPSTLFCSINGVTGCKYSDFKFDVDTRFLFTASWSW